MKDTQPIRIFNTHLANHYSAERHAQLTYLSDHVKQQRVSPGPSSPGIYAQPYPGPATILCCDLNLDSLSNQNEWQLHQGWRDAFQQYFPEQTPWPTCDIHGSDQWPEGPHCHDYFWLQSLRAATLTVDTLTSLSDHQPLWSHSLMIDLNVLEAAFCLPLPDRLPHQVRYLFTDVDDTLTWQGKLPSQTLHALEQLAEAGIQVIAVTGACAGWCDCMVRTWPVTAVIGENGAFWMQDNNSGQIETHYRLGEHQRSEQSLRLLQIQQQLLAHFPFARATADQRYRETDIAFDINQQHQNSQEEIEILIHALESHGLHAQKSSIHINAWAGSYDKASSSIAWLKSRDVMEKDHLTQVAFVGDSANDISMFEQFNITIGVANIAPFVDTLTTPPRYLTKGNGGFGFVELSECLLRSTKS